MANLPAALRLRLEQQAQGGPPAKRPKMEAHAVPAAFQARMQGAAAASRPGGMPPPRPGPLLPGQLAAAGQGMAPLSADKMQAMLAERMQALQAMAGGSLDPRKSATMAASSIGGPRGMMAAAAPSRPVAPKMPKPRAPTPQAMAAAMSTMAGMGGMAGMGMGGSDEDAMMAQLMAMAATSAAQQSAAQSSAPAPKPKPTRSKVELMDLMAAKGCPLKPEYTTNDMEIQLQLADSQEARAKRTRNIPRHEDQDLIKGFREGWFSPGCDELLRQLESGMDPNTESIGGNGFAPGMTAFLAAVGHGKPDEMRILLAAGADVAARTPAGRSALHIVADGDVAAWKKENADAMLRILVDADPALVQARDRQNKRPIDLLREHQKEWFKKNMPEMFAILR
mmetsp:Transcript_93621/g.166578  ORF Transcript_93621/g.166578 Transcript_93621/m.166578 type:complete len:395 (+) Transcript_93621:49-1233(+)